MPADDPELGQWRLGGLGPDDGVAGEGGASAQLAQLTVVEKLVVVLLLPVTVVVLLVRLLAGWLRRRWRRVRGQAPPAPPGAPVITELPAVVISELLVTSPEPLSVRGLEPAAAGANGDAHARPVVVGLTGTVVRTVLTDEGPLRSTLSSVRVTLPLPDEVLELLADWAQQQQQLSGSLSWTGPTRRRPGQFRKLTLSPAGAADGPSVSVQVEDD